MSKIRFENHHSTMEWPVRISRFHCPGYATVIPLHYHDEFEILLIENGTHTIGVNDKEFTAHPGDVVCINTKDLHYITSKKISASYVSIMFLPQFIQSKYFDFLEKEYFQKIESGELTFINHLTDDEKLPPIVDIIVKIYSSKIKEYKDPFWRLNVKGYIYELFYTLASSGYLVKTQKDINKLNENMDLLTKITEYINCNFNTPLTLETVAKEFSMSPNYFCRFFKKNFGKTFVNHLNNVRVSEAAKLLIETEKSILEVCFDCGFNDSSYFIKKFQEIYKVTPLKYRKVLNNNKK